MAAAVLEWSDSFKVGIQEIDEQHRTLIDLLNQLHAAFRDKRSNQACLDILDHLINCTRSHFLLEESLMRVSHYPGFEIHKQQHEESMAQVRALQANLNQGQAAMSFEVLQFLQVWLTRHITESDARFGQHFARLSELKPYAQWSPEVQATMARKKWWWKFW